MEADPEIAAAMGFTSFGGGGSKKRKHPGDDAFVEGQPSPNQPATPGTGSNSTELGPRRRSADDSASEGVATVVSAADSAAPADAGAMPTPLDAASANQDGASQVGKTSAAATTTPSSRPKKPKSKNGSVPSGLAGFLSRGHQLPDKPGSESSSKPAGSTPAATLPVAANPVETPTPSAVEPAQSGDNSLEAFRKGVRDARGDLVYFLPSFIEDPWSKLSATPA